jgi:hypothetical protein
MTRVLRLAAYAIAVAAVIDPRLDSVEPAPIRVGVRLATAAPSMAAERWIADLSKMLPPPAFVARELTSPDAPWCVGLDVCVVVSDGTVSIGGRPELPVHVVRLPAPEVPAVVAAATAPGHALEMRDARIAVAGGAEGDMVDVVVGDGGVEVGRARHRRTDQPIDDVAVPWWPRGAGVRPLTVRTGDPSLGAPASTMLAETSATPAEVLMWDVRPSWTGTFVRRALDADRRLIVRAASQLAPRQLARRGLAGPPTDADLYRARAVVVSGAAALQPAQVARLDRYARAGGSVVVALDEPPAGAVQALMPGPVAAQRRELDAVPLGELRTAELVTFAGGNGDAVVASWDGGPPGQRAVIIERRTGRGRVVVSGALDAWRWRDGGGFDEFWQRLVTRAARASSPPLGVSWVVGPGAARLEVSSRRGVADGAWPPLRLTRTCDGETTPVTPIEGAVPGTWLAEIRGVREGCQVRVESGGDQVETPWPGPPSLPSLPPGGYQLETLAVVSGGTLLDASAGGGAVAAMVARSARPSVPVPWRPTRAWWWFVPFIAALSTEWWVRRRQGRA